jgi:hypothetical protein
MTRPCGSSLKDYTLSCGLGIVAARCGILTLATQPLSKGPLWVIRAVFVASTPRPVIPPKLTAKADAAGRQSLATERNRSRGRAWADALIGCEI